MMIRRIKKTAVILGLLLIIIGSLLFMASIQKTPSSFTYGVSFSKLHADELSLDWKKVYLAALNELGIKHLRLSAHWPNIEPKNGQFDFSALDFQMNEARAHGADVILTVGRRLPGWPECHEPQWAYGFSKEEKQTELLAYVEAVVKRYKNYPNLLYWQVENEAFLTFYAKHHCNDFFDAEFFDKEIQLVRAIDPDTPIFLTDSGELSLWYPAYKRADVFGTSIYLYVWNHTFGAIRYPIIPAFFRIKHNVVELLTPQKPAIVSELSLEPWLLQPIAETPLDVQLGRMDISKFNEIIEFAKKTDFDTHYLWGIEWWYYMKEKNHPEFWERAKEIYLESE
mgnify:CR=1 FL=1